MLPVLRPLKDPAVATVWWGLAASTIGEDLFRVAVVWIVAEQIGNAAGYVNAAQYGAMLAVGLLGGSLFDRWRADRAMIGAKYASAVLALLPVAGFYVWGISIPLLVISVMGLAAMRMVESGFASPEDIDTAMVAGCAHPMGPLALADLIGGGRANGR